MMASVLVGMVVLVKMGHDIQVQVWYILYQPNSMHLESGLQKSAWASTLTRARGNGRGGKRSVNRVAE
jgi:hypothetical protein